MWIPHIEYLRLGESESERQKMYRDKVSTTLSLDVTDKLQHCLNTGLIVGTDAFRGQIEALRD